jgi:triosephosphate isomerase
MRKKIIAGNWKMNKTPLEAVTFAKDLKAKLSGSSGPAGGSVPAGSSGPTGGSGPEVVFCVPFVSLIPVIEALEGSNIAVGAQNMHAEDSGAFTGEISAEMLTSIGVSHVIIGHSERREYFAETDASVNKKVLKAIAAGLAPIVCVGETLTQREQGITIDLVRMQVRIALGGVPASDARGLVIAYEPIWAIGTGRAATKDDAQEVCRAIRQIVRELYDEETAQALRVQYGGSVNAKNAAELFNMPDIDGGLVGGASIKPEFESIVKGA